VSSAGTVSEKKMKRKNLSIFAVDMVKDKENIQTQSLRFQTIFISFTI
jgi:hypothetical protein